MLRSRNIPFFFAIYYGIQAGGGFRTSVRRSRAHFFSVRAGRPARMPGRRVSGRPIQAAGRICPLFCGESFRPLQKADGPRTACAGPCAVRLPAIAAGFERQSDGRAAVCAPAAMRNPRHSRANPARVAARRSPARKSAAVLPKNASARPGGEVPVPRGPCPRPRHLPAQKSAVPRRRLAPCRAVSAKSSAAVCPVP